MMKMRRVMNIQLIVYRIAPVIEVTGKILKNGVEMIAWALIPFLNNGRRHFLAVMKDHYRDFLMMNHCRGFLMMNQCRDFAVFQEFPEFLVEVGMKVVASRNSLLLMTRGVVALLIVGGTVLLMIAAFLE